MSEGTVDPTASPEFAAVLQAAARLQALLPEAVLVGGSAAAVHAGHRLSMDDDHVLADLARRFEAVLEVVESDPGWRTARFTPDKVILGNLDGIETGIRQMIRTRPLETETYISTSGSRVVVPTAEETLRIKAFLVVKRNTVRDYLDCAALSDHVGVERAAAVLSAIDAYYADQTGGGDGVATQVARQFSEPRPKDTRVISELARYKMLNRRWQNWNEVCGILAAVADAMVDVT